MGVNTEDSSPTGRHGARRPRVEIRSGRRQLLVDGRPFLVLGAELHNSSGSSPAALRAGLDRTVELNANTALVPVTWELLEPTEGEFDFELVDLLLTEGRDRGLRVIPLWFASWKNGRSSYAPAWVKRDADRFERVRVDADLAIDDLTPFSPANRAADAAAFRALMRRIATRDPDAAVVPMVQVENEVGLLGASRDRSASALAAFAGEVPRELLSRLEDGAELPVAHAWREHGARASGTWEEVFGSGARTDEAFMAWGYATAVQHIAAAGRRENDVPLFANAWLDGDDVVTADSLTGGREPGIYPSGGPVLTVAEVWRTFAPALDLLSPDIYVGDVDRICAAWSAVNYGGLLIPEMRRDDAGAALAFLALGAHGALGVSPFGIDSGPADDTAAFRDAYLLLRAVAPALTRAATDDMAGFVLHRADDEAEIAIGGQRFTARTTRASADPSVSPGGYGLVVRTEDDAYLAVGRGFSLEPLPRDGRRSGILSVDELLPSPDGLRPGRRLNGDETLAGSAWMHPARGHAAPGRLPIATEGQNSGITACRLYAF